MDRSIFHSLIRGAEDPPLLWDRGDCNRSHSGGIRGGAGGRQSRAHCVHLSQGLRHLGKPLGSYW